MEMLLPPTRLRREQVFASATTPVLALRHVLNGDYERHSHDFMEIAFIFGGNGHHMTPYDDQPLTANDLLIVRPGMWHSFGACHGLVVYNCCFALELLQQPLAWLHAYPPLAELLWDASPREATATFAHLMAAVVPDCEQQLEEMRALIAADPHQHTPPLRLIGHLLILLGIIAQGLEAPPQQPRVVHQTVRAAMDLFMAQLAYPWTLRDVAQQFHIDAAYLVRLFTAQVGYPPMTWLALKRIDRARTLLAQTDLPIAHIAEEVGWPDPNQFARRFRKITGTNARAYRANWPRTTTQPDITHHH